MGNLSKVLIAVTGLLWLSAIIIGRVTGKEEWKEMRKALFECLVVLYLASMGGIT